MSHLTAAPRVVCVPDSFKGSASAAEAAAALARGARQVFPQAEIIELPFADGGEGTLEALLAVWGQEAEQIEVVDAIGRPGTALVGRSADGRTAVLEAAQGNGLPQVSDVPLQPGRADTYGVGLIARHLLDSGPQGGELAVGARVEEVLLCIGGSASTDGGTGLLRALGVEFLDTSGAPVAPGGQGLTQIASVDTTGLHPRAAAVRWRIAVDVDNPLTGERGAAAVFGPQKGADDDAVAALDAGLSHLAEVLAAHTGVSAEQYRQAPGFGAAGGIPVGMVSLLDTEVVPGSQMVGEAVGLAETLAEADIVLTGEGSLDSQSLGGKVVEAVRRHAPQAAAVVVVAGTVKLSAAECRQAGLTGAFSIAPGAAALEELLERAPELIEQSAAQACGLLAHGAG
ncbi:glycerate kinase [Nesterenkonia sp. HG001]|uniref:glycerate kinase n=1 Tax=Nesterenkonia sp. HG001 TaxID=2983207 RepID=UPI002AC4B43E|nr:glycerate kinase [Nesterenkonia sp. HG001]MDZ5077250.1 glycerate kinase [Nesterenkonia sp. HG001]